MNYIDFLSRKAVIDVPTGLSNVPELNKMLFPHQQDMEAA